MIILYRDQQRSGNVFMEKRYRGYPPEVKKVPWMLYRREEQSAGPVLTGNELRSEMDYLRGLYPSAAKRKQVLAEEACDLLEYPGSPMYDEYPDRLQLLLLCRRIYNRAKEDETKEGEETGEWLQNLIQVMTYQELCQRRRENRSMRRKYY